MRPPGPDVDGCNTPLARLAVAQRADESGTVTDTEERVKILTRVADFEWRYDKQTALGHLGEAYKVASARFHEKGFENENDQGILIPKPDLRFRVIEAIAKKDTTWAKKLIDEILAEYEKDAEDKTDDRDKARELSATLNIAIGTVKSDPALSWYLFRRVMTDKLDSHWLFTLYGVASVDQQFADQLYSELLIKYRSAKPRRFLFLSAYPFASDRIVGIDKFQFGSGVPATLAPNPALQMRFITTLMQNFSAFVADPTNLTAPAEPHRLGEPAYVVSALNELQSVVAERFPSLLPQFTELSTIANSILNDNLRQSMDEKNESEAGLRSSFETRIKELEQADEEGKLTDEMIVSVATWGLDALTEDQMKRLLPWIEKIDDKDAREATTNFFWFMRTKRAVHDKRLNDAEAFAAKIARIEFRILVLFEIADARTKVISNSAAAIGILSDAAKQARSAPDSVAKARVLLGLAAKYEKINHAAAIDALSDAVNVINHLQGTEVLNTTIRQMIKTRRSLFYYSVEVPYYDLEETFKIVGKSDLDLTISNATALSNKYLRTIAVIGAAQSCVDNKKTPKKKPQVR
ncbi:MAG TPA: hypothetical protein PLR83_09175 [Pyrinomonadaceae bacterium]|nr:hypothetical protein [Pyrinomonadaceae bacterium]